jgi:hypothetical protein
MGTFIPADSLNYQSVMGIDICHRLFVSLIADGFSIVMMDL